MKKKWRVYMSFCQDDGHELKNDVCPKCGKRKYHNPLPVVVGLIPVHDKKGTMYMLAVRRNIKPLGELALPSGYVEKDLDGVDVNVDGNKFREIHENALIREMEEETGIVLTSGYGPKEKIFEKKCSVRTSSNGDMLIFLTLKKPLSIESIDLKFKNDETQELVLLKASEYEQLVFETHAQEMRAFFA